MKPAHRRTRRAFAVATALVIKDAGAAQIDHLVTTHYHGDHFGAMAELAPMPPPARGSCAAPPLVHNGPAPKTYAASAAR